MSAQTPGRVYVLIGERVLSDGTRYTHFATYEAMNIEAALRQAGRVVQRWRGERVEGHADTAVRDITELQISVNEAA